MDQIVASLLMTVLRGLFERLVPHSLGLASREVLLALFMLGALWIWNKLQGLAPAGTCQTCHRQAAGRPGWLRARLAAV